LQYSLLQTSNAKMNLFNVQKRLICVTDARQTHLAGSRIKLKLKRPQAVCGGGVLVCPTIDVCALKQCPGDCTLTSALGECPKAVCDDASSSASKVMMGLVSFALVIVALVAAR
jgi:hypothetical protein